MNPASRAISVRSARSPFDPHGPAFPEWSRAHVATTSASLAASNRRPGPAAVPQPSSNRLGPAARCAPRRPIPSPTVPTPPPAAPVLHFAAPVLPSADESPHSRPAAAHVRHPCPVVSPSPSSTKLRNLTHHVFSQNGRLPSLVPSAPALWGESAIPHAGSNGTFSKVWKLRVTNESRAGWWVVESSSRQVSMAA